MKTKNGILIYVQYNIWNRDEKDSWTNIFKNNPQMVPHPDKNYKI